MNFILQLSLVFSFAGIITAMDEDNVPKELIKSLIPTEKRVFFSKAHCGQDLSKFKELYLAIYTELAQSLLSEKQLSERFDSLQSLIGKDNDFYFILFKQDKNPVGFLPFFKKTVEKVPSAIIYDTPILPDVKRDVLEVIPVIVNVFDIKKGYCFVGKGAKKIKEMVIKEGFSKDNDAPITMNNNIAWNPERYTKYSHKNLKNN